MFKFAKYHGCGNDFILVRKKDIESADYAGIAVEVCHRHTGLGADGFIIVGEGPEKDIPVEMIFYNSDGSLAPMCGNGIRCFAHYCHDEGIVTEDIYSVKTGAGTMIVGVQSRDPFKVEIDMGKPDFDTKASAIDTDLPEFLAQKVQVDEWTVPLSTFFMGTIHTVVWNEDIPVFDKEAFGAKLSNHPIFKEKTNVNMVKVIDRNTISLMTYERGAGMTLACGTGACASVVCGIKEGRLNDRVKVILPLGELIVTRKEDGNIFMQGPSEKVADGILAQVSESSDNYTK